MPLVGVLVARVIRESRRAQIWTMYQYIDALAAETPAGHSWGLAGERLPGVRCCPLWNFDKRKLAMVRDLRGPLPY